MAKQLTVKELVTLLLAVDQDLPVEIEGCDCFGDATHIEVFESSSLLIRRDEEWDDE
jgi:hypothetical protein